MGILKDIVKINMNAGNPYRKSDIVQMSSKKDEFILIENSRYHHLSTGERRRLNRLSEIPDKSIGVIIKFEIPHNRAVCQVLFDTGTYEVPCCLLDPVAFTQEP